MYVMWSTELILFSDTQALKLWINQKRLSPPPLLLPSNYFSVSSSLYESPRFPHVPDTPLRLYHLLPSLCVSSPWITMWNPHLGSRNLQKKSYFTSHRLPSTNGLQQRELVERTWYLQCNNQRGMQDFGISARRTDVLPRLPGASNLS